ncbi:MAG: PEGA domain-containing protein [Candidatus Doudnabacteria bacterium]
MTLRNRFTLVIFGIILFLIITPALVLYARGFKIDWQNHKITKTGAMVIKTDPSNADVFLNDIKQAGQTPSNIRFLLPGDYDVRIEKDGYQSWTKRLSVKEQYVTTINLDRDFISLFLKKPQLAQSWTAGSTSLSNTRDEIVFLNGEQVNVINTNNGDLTNPGSISGIKLPALPQVPLIWQNSKAVFQAIEKRADWGLTDDQISQITRIETDGAHTSALIGPDLYVLDNTAPLLLEKNVLTFTLENDNIWYLTGNFLKRFNYSTNQTATISTTAPIATSGQIIPAGNQIYAILNSSLFVLNDSFEKIYDNAAEAFWNADAKLLTFSNNNEILTYNPADQKTDLILRSAGQIKDPVLNWTDGYVFFENEKQVKAVELDGRDHRNIYTIAGLPDDQSSFTVSSDSRTLYIFNSTQISKYGIQ